RLTEEDVSQWSESLQNILICKKGRSVFRSFLKTEYSDENFEFWVACEDYKKHKSGKKMASKARKIFDNFISSESSREINIDFHTRKEITDNLHQPSISIFENAQKIVYSHMERDSYPRFLKSDIYKAIAEKSKAK
ncbi:regulator of G-protein signaling 1-like, partial [Protopterus annectens]|uniref:regulator of G-protein signaling 1-like n=1 Tax=Protopterus annectens TaxID=7888 RepID=UPI001CF98F52